MPRSDYKNCKGCGRSSEEAGPLSHTRLCGDCAEKRLLLNSVSLHTRQGQPYVHFHARRYLTSRKVLIDAGLLTP